MPEVVYGNELVTGLNSTANPHYLDADHEVYNDPVSPDNYNDDRIALLNTTDNTTTTLSADGVRASNHMRSKRGDHEIVVFEEMARSIEAAEMNTEDDFDKASELSTQQRIVANVRTAGGQWKRTVVSDAAGVTDAKPIVTMQDDGHAACVWLRGNVKKNEEAMAASEGDDDGGDDFFNTYLDGQMVLSVYDGNTWSAPVNLFSVGKDNVAKQYDLFMRNDTVLVGANFTKNFYDETLRTTQFTYASVPLSTKTPSYVEESLHPLRFFMNRVGEHAVIALLYEKNDTLSDIYVKTLAMNGHDDGRTGNDLGARFCSPRQVKIICDRHADDRSVNGLSEDSELHVGLFASPLASSLISSGAKTVVRASDFVEFGGVRKAYAKVQVSGVAETTNALLNLFVVRKVNDNGVEKETLIDNVHANDNAHYVYLQPSNNPTDINPVRFQDTKSRLTVTVTAEAGGVRISGLPTGSDVEGRPYHVRIYNAAGMGMYSQPTTSESIFVPLSQHGVYVLSTGKDILKFQF